MKIFKSGLFAILMLTASLGQAEYYGGESGYFDDDYANDEKYNVADVATEILLLRPLGVAGMFVGTAAFLATLPFSALASIAPPHDAMGKAATVFVTGPANYAFVRPFAHYDYDPHGDYGLRDE